MSLAGPRAQSKKSSKSKKGPLSATFDEDVAGSAHVKKTKAESGKGKQKVVGVDVAEKEATPGVTELSKLSKKVPAPKKGILKNAKDQDPSPSTSTPVTSKENVDETEAVEEQEILLHGFSSESDSSDEEDDVMDDAPLDVGKLPTIAKDDASVKRRLEKAKKQASGDRGVIYLGRIPHGFYEDEMRAYFTQFGDVTRLRLSRNKRTGRSKHYAFIEFESAAVAQIVAETMDNYLMLGHILRCKVLPKEEIHPQLWIGANRKFRRVPTARIARQQQNKTRTVEEQVKAEERLLKRQVDKKRKLVAAGIDYDMDPVGYSKRTKQSA
ncbi:hypothetical protein SCHPADRAFT_846618 [Schizopora paradoxa]|uniref:RRM domain-containing protein n=1 Tax=Schizopora paradoxa TaxID=27342 RepID=A0A0H2S0P6_9AGAM|nr:hypothetical protein SCHPADRAFT_846618 [Schizopora paradoxa]